MNASDLNEAAGAAAASRAILEESWSLPAMLWIGRLTCK